MGSSSSVWRRRKRKLSRARRSTGSFSSRATRRSTVNHYYFYIDDADFGPLFAYTDREVVYRDGSSIFATAGLVSHLLLPGEGLVAANVGFTSATFDTAGNLLDFHSAGDHDGRLRFLVCPYLE